MARALQRLGLFAARRKWAVLGAWVVVVAGLVALSHVAGSNTSNNLNLPGTDSQAASNLLAAQFPPRQNGNSPLVFHAPAGTKVTDSQNKQAIEASYKQVRKLPHVANAVDPFSQQGAAQISKDGRTAYIPVLLDVSGDELTQEIARSVLDAGNPAAKTGMQVAVGGPVGSELSEPATESSEVIGIVAAMVILAFTFGTLVAMGLPIVSAVFGLAAGLSLIVALGHVATVPSIAPTLATMIGLGVGIDYALFLVSRHRANRQDGMPLEESIANAVATSGSAIVFAGTTVVVALLTLGVAGIPMITALGYSSAVAVATAVVAAITLMPALLALVGTHIESLRLPAFLRPRSKDPERGFWGGYARLLTRNPWVAIIGLLVPLCVLIVPFFSLNFGQVDVGAAPKSTTERQAYDLMSAGFGPGYNGPLLVAVELPTPAKASTEYTSQYQQATSLQKQLQQEQKTGQSQAASLQAQANALTRQEKQLEQQQGTLEQQQKQLEQQAKADQKQQAQLQAEANRLVADQVALNKQIASTSSQAKQVVREGAQTTKELASVVAKLKKNQAQQRKVEAELQHVTDPAKKAKLEAKLHALQQTETKLQTQLNTLVQQEQANRQSAAQLVTDATALGDQEVAVANRAISLAGQAATLARDAVQLVEQKQKLLQQASALQVEAANLQTQAAELQTQQVTLEGQQQTAQGQQQQAEQLKTQLTNELTKAGGDPRGTDPRLVTLQDGLGSTVGVKVVSPPLINHAGTATAFSVIATTAPADPATATLVRTLRVYTVPQATQGTNVQAYVGGTTASYVDLADAISAKLLLVIGVVIALSFCILLMAFRSFIFATQAAVANILSVTAAFGVLTAVFQKGWGLSLVGLDTASGTNPIASYVPLMMFTVLFGLSMDYQVFLISKIEQHRQGNDDIDAIRLGVTAGARVIVAAALIMMFVFGSFVLNADQTVKQFGVGLSVGVALAAASVLVFAPAVLVLAGSGKWWVPRWLDRTLPHIDVEGTGVEVPEVAADNAIAG
jgi:uncharacterized membrane protein YdfJ with MMPL/SSD domain